MKSCLEILSILILVLLFSCQESKTTFHNESLAVKDSLSSDAQCPIQNDAIDNAKFADSLDIVESIGYEHGYDKGFDDAGSEMYADEPGELCFNGKYQKMYLDAFKKGYEEGWIEWKNRNDDYDY